MALATLPAQVEPDWPCGSRRVSRAEATIGRVPASPAQPGSGRYRLLDREVLADPYPTYAHMRAADPVYRERRFGWVLTQYDDIAWALRAPHLSAHRPLPDEPVPQPLAAIADEVRALRRLVFAWVLFSDPPPPTRRRAAVGGALSP